MPATLTWSARVAGVPLDHDGVGSALARAAADAGDGGVDIAMAFSGEAQMTIVVGDLTGTSLWYFFGDSAETAGFLSLGDSEAANSGQADPPIVVNRFGDHTEFPRYSVIPHALGEQALHEFIDNPTVPPLSVTWIAL